MGQAPQGGRMDTDSGLVVLINLFEVPAGAEEDFIAAWERAREFLQAQPGYIATRLHESLRPDADLPLHQRRHLGEPTGVPGGHPATRVP